MDKLIEQVQVLAHRRLVADTDRVFLTLPPGLPLASYLSMVWTRLEGVHARVEIDGQRIDRAEWGTYCLNPGQVVTARAIPMGGGGGGGKGVMRIVALIGVVVLAAFTAGGGLAALGGVFAALTAGSLPAGLAGAVISLAGSLAINARIPPARPRLKQVSHG